MSEKKEIEEYIEPILDWVVVMRSEKGLQVTKGGIHLPEETQARHKPIRATVIAVGPGAWKPDGSGRLPMTLKKGQSILIRAWSGDRVGAIVGGVVNGPDNLAMLKEQDCLGVIHTKE